MTEPTKDQRHPIEQLRAYACTHTGFGEGVLPADLQGYTAQAAIDSLLNNWRDALADGNTDNLVGDIDKVIDHLRGFQMKAIEVLPVVNGGRGDKPEAAGYFRTVFQVEVLSEDAPVADLDLADVVDAITEGDCSGQVSVVVTQGLTAARMARALDAQGSDPGFFGLEDEADESADVPVTTN